MSTRLVESHFIHRAMPESVSVCSYVLVIVKFVCSWVEIFYFN